MTASRTVRRRLAGGVLALLVGAGALAGCSADSGATTTVSTQQWLDTAEAPGVVVIDVRTPAEYAAGHVDGAVNIDVESADFATRVQQLDPEGAYALYCRSGNRSGAAADQMADLGFTDVTNLDGGVADLQAAGASIVTE